MESGVYIIVDVFPARAGMSRIGESASECQHGFPRTRGDEPTANREENVMREFSPHARG